MKIYCAQEVTLGLAAAFQQGNVTLATALITPVVPSLLEQVPDGMDERANALLATAYTQLQRNADKITDSALRHSYWQVLVHRKIRELWIADPTDSPPANRPAGLSIQPVLL